MLSKTRIAVLVAALFLGAQAGIAALEQDPSIASVETAEPTQQVEATEPAATEAPQATAAAEQPAAETAPAAAPAQIVRARVSDTFPRSPSGSDMLPGLAAYLEQVEASRSHLVARGDVFPRSPNGIEDMLPGLVAYLDQRDGVRIARTQVQPAPAAPAAEVQPAAPVALAPQQPASTN